MGIKQSVMRSDEIETDEEENGNSSREKYLTVSVPELKGSSSLASTIVNDEVKIEAAATFAKENAPPPETCRVPVVVKCRVAAAEGRWIKHYSSCHRILLVGEGDFSFSTCLAAAFGWASNMVATSLDSQDFLVKNYGSALSNLVELSIRNCRVMHEINATTMANDSRLSGMKFDRIIYNFPFAGFFKGLSRDAQLRRHRSLVSGFMENAKEMLSENGEIHITHKTNEFHKEWKLEVVASIHRLMLVEAVDFNHLDYQGYNTKCGFGGDNNFNCYPSKTYKFRL
ncbi:hypothetical protein C2S51_013469 [Perilla frutescens var. frutescens]|nr:hypothetical protein C2S51_013469 [Perilla frutescens var. frutescens]